MRQVRVRELLLLVVIVALGLGWWVDRTHLHGNWMGAERSTGRAMARAEASDREEKLILRVANAELARRKRAEAALAECEGREEP